MGLAKNWTKEEVDYLQEYWGVKSIKSIAKKLNRSVNAVKIKAQKIGLVDPRFSFDGITVNQLAIALKEDYRKVKNWIKVHDFPVKKRIFAIENRVLIVTYQDFWKWAESHKQLLSFDRLEENLLGPEPAWVKEKRKADIANKVKPHNEPWSKNDDAKLLNLVQAYKYTYPEIAKILQRTETAIKRRLYDLGIKARPVRLNNHIKWTDEETETILDMFNKGYSFRAIAEKVGKSELAVRGKFERMGFKFKGGVAQ